MVSGITTCRGNYCDKLMHTEFDNHDDKDEFIWFCSDKCLSGYALSRFCNYEG